MLTVILFYSIAGVRCPLSDLNVNIFAHGSIDTRDGNEYEDIVTYSCDAGYVLSSSGNKVRKCGADRTWQGVPPTCEGT